jgi:hypothetical protein
VFWLPSHARLRPGLPDEQPEGIKHYNDQMCSYFRKVQVEQLVYACVHVSTVSSFGVVLGLAAGGCRHMSAHQGCMDVFSMCAASG